MPTGDEKRKLMSQMAGRLHFSTLREKTVEIRPLEPAQPQPQPQQEGQP